MIPSQNRQYTQDERYRKIKARVTKFNKMNVTDDYNTQTKDMMSEMGEINVENINKLLIKIYTQLETIYDNYENLRQQMGVRRSMDNIELSKIFSDILPENKDIQININLLINSLKNFYQIIPILQKNSKIQTLQNVENLLNLSNIVNFNIQPLLNVGRQLRATPTGQFIKNIPENVNFYINQIKTMTEKLNYELNTFSQQLRKSIGI